MKEKDINNLKKKEEFTFLFCIFGETKNRMP